MLRFRYAAASHAGLVRSNNEDAGYAGAYLLLVADGVGGAAAGEVASASTTYLASTVSMISDDDPLAVLAQVVELAHLDLQDGVAADPEREGMATTLTAVLGDGDRFGLVHIGDSRAYQATGGEFIRITKDHSLLQMMLDSGELSPDQVGDFQFGSVISRSINQYEDPDPDLVLLDLQLGDRLLLASDGLTDLVSDERLSAAVNSTDDLDEVVEHLVQLALDAGGRDNITCVMGELVAGDQIHPRGRMIGAAGDPRNLIDGAAIKIERVGSRRTARLQSPLGSPQLTHPRAG